MAEDGNRVKISPQLDETLNEILDKRKNLGEKDLTKVRLLDQICKAGINHLNENRKIRKWAQCQHQRFRTNQ
jgi:hypothetical protein